MLADRRIVLRVNKIRESVERLGNHPFGIEPFLVRLGNHRAMQVIERFVRDNAGRHVHDVVFRDGLGLAVGIERLAEQTDGSRRGRGGEGHEHLVGVVLADDLGDLFLLVLLGGFGTGFLRLAKRPRATNRATALCTVWFFSCFNSSATIGRPFRKKTKSISWLVSPK